MPVFINEVVIRTELPPSTPGAGPATPTGTDVDRAALIREIMRSLLDQIERERDRVGER